MERSNSLLSLSSRSSSSDQESFSSDLLLSYQEKPWPLKRRVPRVRALLGNCLYRRLLLWVAAGLTIAGLVLLHHNRTALSRAHELVHSEKTVKTVFANPTPEGILDPKPAAKPAIPPVVAPHIAGKHEKQATLPKGDEEKKVEQSQPESHEILVDNNVMSELVKEFKDAMLLDDEEDKAMREQFEKDAARMPWLRFKHLDGFYHGLKTLVNKKEHVPEYPDNAHNAPLPEPAHSNKVPKPEIYSPYQAGDKSGLAPKTCYVDSEEKVPAPDLYAYNGIPQHMPDPALGSYDLFGIRDDVCFDRFGRYGPYGLGYTKAEGGLGVGLETESSGSEAVWGKTGKINFHNVDWADAQDRCQNANKHRLAAPLESTGELPAPDAREGKKGRTAIVMRCYTGFKWTELAVLNLRAMISEVSLRSGGEYTVHILLHVRDDSEPIWSDDATVQRILETNVPGEFHGLVSLWSVSQMMLFYPGRFEKPWQNPSGQGIHGVYRSAHMPMQIFGMQHPEYEHFWNWEMDLRFLGNYYEFFDRLGQWADQQPRALMWERNERYYIPAYHGSWENFTDTVARDSGISYEHNAAASIVGPIWYEGKKQLRFEERGESPLPESCRIGKPAKLCGVGEGADIISLDPIFDVNRSGWVFSNDVTGYQNPTSSSPPRRASIVTAGRISRRLLTAMHEEVWRHHQSTFTEMFHTTVALHRGFKAVYAPHPIYMDRAWQSPGGAVEKAFNSGEDSSTSGRNSPFDMRNEHNQKGTSFYYHSEFAGLLWRRWLGYAQMDGRGRFGGRGGTGALRGGLEEESMRESSGRMCLRSMLLHPIKHERPDE